MAEPTTEQVPTGQRQLDVAPITAESIAAIVDGRINNFVHSSKTDMAKMKEQLTGVTTAIESLKPKESPVETAATTTTQTIDPKTSVLERQIKELQETNQRSLEKAAKADRDSALNKALSGFNFANETSRDMAYQVFASQMKDLGDGSYAIGDQPLGDAIKGRMADLSGLIAPKNIGGSGASNQSAPGNLSSIFKAGMTRVEQQALASKLAKEL